MTQKNIWNISVKELMEKYQVTEQGLTTAARRNFAWKKVKISCKRVGEKVYRKYLSVSLLICL